MTIVFPLDEYANISRVIHEPQYAHSKHLLVKKCKSVNLQFLEQQLYQLSVHDKHFHTHLARIREEIKKESVKNRALYVIKYDKKFITEDNIYTLGQFRSVIVDHERIICFSPPKAIPFQKFKDTWGTAANSIIPLEFVEGTMINVFYDLTDNLWEIATRSNIGGYYKFYKDHTKTFRTMFLEAANHSKSFRFPEALDKEYCYSFVLQHPDNRIVTAFQQPKIVLTNIYKCDGSQIHALSYAEICAQAQYPLGVEVPRPLNKVLPANLNQAGWQKRFQDKSLDYRIMGAIFLHPSGARTKLRNPNYEYVHSLKGNCPKLQFQYYYLRYVQKVKEFLAFYPEYKKKCNKLRWQLHTWTLQLFKNYIRCYIKKEKPLREFSKEFRTHMYSLHQIYLNELVHKKLFITRRRVIDYVNKLEPARLMYSINYKLREEYLEDNIKKQIIKINKSFKI